MAIPLSVSGLLYSFYLFDATFDCGGDASIMLLVGIGVNTSILQVNHISKALASSNSKDKLTVIIEAAAQRVRPIIVTMVTPIVGLLPLVLFETMESLWYPLAVGTIIWLVASSGFILITQVSHTVT